MGAGRRLPRGREAPDSYRVIRSLSVVVPVHDAEPTLPALLARLEPVLSGAAESFEVVLVDDASRDRSWETIRALARPLGWVRGVRLATNAGQHAALLCGLRFARGEVIVTMDDDLQHPPEEIPRLLAELERGRDVVYGVPARSRHGLLRTLASALTRIALAQAMGAEAARHASPFRAMRREVLAAFADYRGPFVAIDVLLSWGAARYGWTPVRHDPRAAGRSGYTLGKLVRHALVMTTGFSTLPLRLASWIGFGFTLFGVGVLAWVLGRYVVAGGSVPGFPFLASVIAIFSGAQLFALGIIGEYLAAIHFRAMNRPAYVVRELAETAASAPCGERPDDALALPKRGPEAGPAAGR